MNKYEATFILDPREDLDALKKSVKEILIQNGAEITEEKEIGIRKLAYPIKKRDKGCYFTLFIKIGSQKLEFLKREFNLKETVLRYLFLKLEK